MRLARQDRGPSARTAIARPRTGVVITGLSLTLSPYFLSAFVTRFPNALSERPISRFSSFKVLDLAPPFFFRTVVFIAISSSARSGAIVFTHLHFSAVFYFSLIRARMKNSATQKTSPLPRQERSQEFHQDAISGAGVAMLKLLRFSLGSLKH